MFSSGAAASTTGAGSSTTGAAAAASTTGAIGSTAFCCDSAFHWSCSAGQSNVPSEREYPLEATQSKKSTGAAGLASSTTGLASSALITSLPSALRCSPSPPATTLAAPATSATPAGLDVVAPVGGGKSLGSTGTVALTPPASAIGF